MSTEHVWGVIVKIRMFLVQHLELLLDLMTADCFYEIQELVEMSQMAYGKRG